MKLLYTKERYLADVERRIDAALAKGMPEEAKLLFLGELKFASSHALIGFNDAVPLRKKLDEDYAQKYNEALDFHAFGEPASNFMDIAE